MSQQIPTYDDKNMKSGTFYEMRVNKDQATALVEAPPSPIHFSNMKYLTQVLTTNHSIEIWEVRKYGDKELKFNITFTPTIEWFIEASSNTLTILSNTPIDGFVKFI